MRTLPKGCRYHGQRVEACVRVDGRLYTKRFPRDVATSTLRDWRRLTRLAAKQRPPEAGATLTDDASRYLRAVADLDTYDERVRMVGLWVEALGPDRVRASVTPAEIAAVLASWSALAPQTRLHRLNVLAHLWRTLDGAGAPNPVRSVARPRVVPPPLALVTPETVGAILATMRPSKTRARLHVIATTGLPHAQLAAVTPADLDLDAGTLRTAPRRKGAGAAGRLLPLAPAAVAAFRELVREDAFGAFSTSAMRGAFLRACARARAAGVAVPDGLRPYDLRHTFGATLYRATHDLATVARLMGHATPAITARYTVAATQDVDRAAVRAASGALAKVGKSVGRRRPRAPKSLRARSSGG